MFSDKSVSVVIAMSLILTKLNAVIMFPQTTADFDHVITYIHSPSSVKNVFIRTKECIDFKLTRMESLHMEREYGKINAFRIILIIYCYEM